MGVGIRTQAISFGKEKTIVFSLISKTEEKGFRWNNGQYEAIDQTPLVGTEFEKLARKYLKDVYYQLDHENNIRLFGSTFNIKDDLKRMGFKWGGYEPTPNWKVPFSNEIAEELNKKYKLNIFFVVPQKIKDIVLYEPKGITLYDHQKLGIQLINQHQTYLLSWQMGSGKTFAPLSYAKSQNKKVFAVVPASIRLNWYKEGEIFGFSPMIFPKLMPMKKVHRERFNKYKYEETGIINDLAITSYTTLNKQKDVLKLIVAQYDLFVFDESQMIKNYKAQRTKTVLELIRLAKAQNKKVVFLSGTPLLNRPAELFTTLKVLIPNLEGFMAFTRKYNSGHDNGYGWAMGAPSNLPELHSRMSKVSNRVLKKDCLDLPEKTRQDVLLAGIKVIVPEEPEDSSQLLGWMQKYKVAVAESKIKETIELASSGNPCVIFTSFIDVNKQITKALRENGLKVGQIYSGVSQADRNEVIEKYQSGEIDVVVGGIKAMGVGITLTRGSNVIFNDMDWTPGNMLQAEDRAHRVGQKNNVTVTILVVQDEFDQMLWSMINSKYSAVTQVLDGVVDEFSSTSALSEMRKHFMNKFKIENKEE